MVKLAVVGLYNSGSTAVAGVLHRLGVHMGPPFWGEHYESAALRTRLVAWWDEPHVHSKATRHDRVAGLREWIDAESPGRNAVGAKHPLLSVCIDEVVEAWGEDTRIVWAYRPLEESITGLRRRGWFPDPERLQTKLWQRLNELLVERPHVAIDHRALTSDPARVVDQLAEQLGLGPTSRARGDAIASVRRR